MTTVEKDKLRKAAANDESRAIEAAKNGEFMNASFQITSALQKYTKLSDSKKIQELKKLQVEYNQKAEPLQSHQISIPLDDNMRAELEKLIRSFTDKPTLAENLFRIAKSAILVPRVEEAKKNAKNIRPVTAQLVTHMLIDEDGHTLSYDDFDSTWLQEHYGISFNFSRDILNTVISNLIGMKLFNQEEIMNVIANTRLYTTSQLLKIDAALERRFANDYFSAVHILTPLIENLLCLYLEM